jgi:hypothetical protein
MYGNIGITAISLKEFEWVEKFIAEYKDKVSPDNYEVVVNFVNARLSFAKGKFDETLKYLNKIKTIKHIQYKMPVKDLTLMTYYELSMLSQVFYQVDSYRHFLRNNKEYFADVRFDRVSNFLKAFTRLAKVREKNNRSELLKLKDDVESSTNIMEKSWILQKINEIN